jgi:hypothetical protein
VSVVKNGNGKTNGHAVLEPAAYYEGDEPAPAMLAALAEFERTRKPVSLPDSGLLTFATDPAAGNYIGEAAVISYKHPRNPKVLAIRPKLLNSIVPSRMGEWSPCIRAEERLLGKRLWLACRPWRTGLESQVLAALEHAYGRLVDGDQLHQYHRPDRITAEPVELKDVVYSHGGRTIWIKWLGLWHSAYRYGAAGRSAKALDEAVMISRRAAGIDDRPNHPNIPIV